MFYDPVRLQTLASFSAPDPWSGNQFTDYNIEEYVMMPLGSKRALESKWSLHAIGIRWEHEPRYRLLPESLVELWKCNSIAPEKLPSLLHAMESRLIETDFTITQSWQRAFGIPFVMLLLFCPVIFLLIRVDGQTMPAGAAIASGLGLALFTGAIMWIMKSSKRSRAKQQMTWAIHHLSKDLSAGPAPDREAPDLETPGTLFLGLWLKLSAALIAIVALALVAGFAFFKFSG